MEFIFALGGLLLFAWILNLQKRIKDLEEGHVASAPRVNAGPAPTPTPQQQAVSQPAPVRAPTPREPDVLEKAIDWIKEDWLLKLGALLVLIGFGWFATYAFLNNWIGPMGRISSGVIAGVLILIFGWWRIKKYVHQGSIFMALGSTTIIITIFAAREVYGYFTPLSALAVMFLSTAFVTLGSVHHKVKSLSIVSLALAGVAPMLINWPSLDYETLFAYLLVVTLGAIWIIILTGWRELTTAALIIISFYSIPYFLGGGTEANKDIMLLYAFAFSAIFFITNSIGILKLKAGEIKSDLITAAGNGGFLLAWILVAAPEEWQSLIIATWMIVFAAGAFMLFKATARREPFYVYAGVGIALMAAATAIELEGPALTIAYIIESALIPLIAYFILKNIQVAERLSLLLIGSVLLSMESIFSREWRFSAFHDDFVVLALLSLVMLGLGSFFLRLHKEQGSSKGKGFSIATIILGSVYVFILIWLTSHAGQTIREDTATLFSLVIYTLVGLATYFRGGTQQNTVLRMYGGVLLGLVVIRLLLVDVWDMALTRRIITFFLIGALLMATAFFGRHHDKAKIPTENK